jgi:hypothetical protein
VFGSVYGLERSVGGDCGVGHFVGRDVCRERHGEGGVVVIRQPAPVPPRYGLTAIHVRQGMPVVLVQVKLCTYLPVGRRWGL